MGGPGSGRWPRRGTRTLTDEVAQIDARELQKKGFLVSGAKFTRRWRAGCGGLRVCGHVQQDSLTMGIEYRSTGAVPARTWGIVDVDRTRCHFGGERAWFVCPQPECGRRVAILYLNPEIACRKCLGLTYASQREDEYLRAWRRARKQLNRLGGFHTLDLGLPRPRYMHHRIHRRLASAIDRDIEFSAIGTDHRIRVADVLMRRVEERLLKLQLKIQSPRGLAIGVRRSRKDRNTEECKCDADGGNPLKRKPKRRSIENPAVKLHAATSLG